MHVSWQLKFPATCQHVATTLSLSSIQPNPFFFNGEHASIAKNPWKFKWPLEGTPSTVGFRNLRSNKGTMHAQWAMPPPAAQTRDSTGCHLGHRRIINRMSTLCGSWGQLGDIVQFLPEVCRPGDAFFRAAGQCDIAAHVQGPLDSAKRGRRRNCERRGEGDSKSGNVTKQWNAGSLWTCSDGESKDSGMSCQGDKNEAADKNSLWFGGWQFAQRFLTHQPIKFIDYCWLSQDQVLLDPSLDKKVNLSLRQQGWWKLTELQTKFTVIGLCFHILIMACTLEYWASMGASRTNCFHGKEAKI